MRLSSNALEFAVKAVDFLFQRRDLALILAPLQHLRSVLMWRYGLKMFRVYALSHSALVVNLHASLDEPEVNGIRNAMGLARDRVPGK